MTLWPLCSDPGCVQRAASVTFSEVWPISSVMASCASQLISLLTFCKTMRCMLLSNNHHWQSNTHKSEYAERKTRLPCISRQQQQHDQKSSSLPPWPRGTCLETSVAKVSCRQELNNPLNQRAQHSSNHSNLTLSIALQVLGSTCSGSRRTLCS